MLSVQRRQSAIVSRSDEQGATGWIGAREPLVKNGPPYSVGRFHSIV